jgi:hypothetical protein
LSDPKKRAFYDETGMVAEDNVFMDKGNVDWDEYWRAMFKVKDLSFIPYLD